MKHSDKLFIIILSAIIILGVIVRVAGYDKVGFWTDDAATIPASILYYYPHDYFPGLASSPQPALGDRIIGYSCLLSGEDFSGVSNIKPQFFPGREMMLGAGIADADLYCHLPMYIFGILLFITVIIFAMVFLDKHSALYAIAFFAFFSLVLKFSKWLKVDIIVAFFGVAALLFLWLGLSSNNEKKVYLFFGTAFAFIGMATATKFSGGFFLLFGLLTLLIRFKPVVYALTSKIFNNIGLKSFADRLNGNLEKLRQFIITLAISSASFYFFLLLPHDFKLSNIIEVYRLYNSVYSSLGGITFNLRIFETLANFLYLINVFDIVIAAFSAYIIIRIITKKNKDLKETYLSSFFLLFIIVSLFSQIFALTRVMMMITVMFAFIMSLAFSKKEYGLKFISGRIFYIFIIAYVILSFNTAYSSAPYHEYRNPVLCYFNDRECNLNYLGYSNREVADLLKPMLSDNETFIPMAMAHWYLRQNDSLYYYVFEQRFKQNTGKEPMVEDFLKYYRPEGRFPRYYLVNSFGQEGYVKELYENYAPNYIAKVNGVDSVYVYDILNLKKLK